MQYFLFSDLFWFESDVMGNHTSLNPLHVNEVYQVTLTLVKVNLQVFREEDPSCHIEILNELLKGIHHVFEYYK